jgi:hypothetical protein
LSARLPTRAERFASTEAAHARREVREHRAALVLQEGKEVLRDEQRAERVHLEESGERPRIDVPQTLLRSYLDAFVQEPRTVDEPVKLRTAGVGDVG